MSTTAIGTIPVSTLFEVGYGNKFDLKNMSIAQRDNPDGVAFVSRSSRNLGVSAWVVPHDGTEPFPPGLITVALGGSYLLSAFVQVHRFYTAQNVAVLVPRSAMTPEEKLFYCLCIGRNRFKYSAFGREANRTLKDIEVPVSVPSWVGGAKSVAAAVDATPLSAETVLLTARQWKWYRYDDLFTIKKGQRVVNNDLVDGPTPCIRPIAINNGIDGHVALEPNHQPNTITVSYNGSVGEAFYQPEPYFATDDVNVLYPKFDMTPFIALFLLPLIRKERYRYNFGRKWNLDRMNASRMCLPIKADATPDWQFMECYIKTLPYSAAIS